MQVEWEKVSEYSDIIFEKANGMGKITINRPEVRNAFRPETLTELIDAFNYCREDPQIGVVILTGAQVTRRSALAAINAFEDMEATSAATVYLV